MELIYNNRITLHNDNRNALQTELYYEKSYIMGCGITLW